VAHSLNPRLRGVTRHWEVRDDSRWRTVSHGANGYLWAAQTFAVIRLPVLASWHSMSPALGDDRGLKSAKLGAFPPFRRELGVRPRSRKPQWPV
jgi:hypothetical protein